MLETNQWCEFTLVLPCPVHCAYCCQDTLTSRYKANGGTEIVMPYGIFLAILDHIPTDRVRIDFSGMADCSYHPQLVEFMEEVARRNGHMTVFTTFQGMTKDNFDRMCKIPIDILSVHLPSAHTDHMKIGWSDDYRYCLQGIIEKLPKSELLDCMCMIGPPTRRG